MAMVEDPSSTRRAPPGLAHPIVGNGPWDLDRRFRFPFRMAREKKPHLSWLAVDGQPRAPKAARQSEILAARLAQANPEG